jgi:serine/threonine protein kinase
MQSIPQYVLYYHIFKIDKVIGEGSFGKALLCRRKDNAKRCIIKLISLGHLSPKEARQTQQEASLLERLNHPNIVSFWDSFVIGPNLFIVMEFADGRILLYSIQILQVICFKADPVVESKVATWINF